MENTPKGQKLTIPRIVQERKGRIAEDSYSVTSISIPIKFRKGHMPEFFKETEGKQRNQKEQKIKKNKKRTKKEQNKEQKKTRMIIFQKQAKAAIPAVEIFTPRTWSGQVERGFKPSTRPIRSRSIIGPLALLPLGQGHYGVCRRICAGLLVAPSDMKRGP
jgi:hypothetical protein